MVEVMFAEPGVEQIAFMPTISGARRFSRTLWSHAGPDDFRVADDEGSVVGFAWLSEHDISLAPAPAPPSPGGDHSVLPG